MERPNNVGDRKDQSNSNGKEEIQHGSTGNQRNPMEPNWTTNDQYVRDASILRLRRGKCSTHSGSVAEPYERLSRRRTSRSTSWIP
ncbi:unnamed protein product [Schistosoma margrebowiei]|uniref:Uncharacterized protein n=1 Tax=Schistosoma margrebowiei TaxID=48269 RepID=A0A183NCU7_9TREM|nr:unnamed protein product [Schistosoma margrebowiei]